MATIQEKPESRDHVGDESIEFLFRIKGTDDEATAMTALLTMLSTGTPGSTVYASNNVDLYWDQRPKLRPVPKTVDETNTKGMWDGILSFVRPENVDPDQVDPDGEYNFEVTGLSAKITQSLETISSLASSEPPDFKGAIGVDGDGKVQGADIIVPQSSFSIVKDLPPATVNATFRTVTVPGLVGKTNDTTFEDYLTGEVLLEGVSGSRLGGVGNWRMTYRFLVSKDATGIEIGDLGTINKAGWDYLWILYEDKEDAVAKKVVKEPVAAYVERVYKRGDFSGLGL